MSYHLKPLEAPRLAGAALRLFTALAETPGAGAPLRRAMLKAAGIPAFRATPSGDASIVVPPLPGADHGTPDHGTADAGPAAPPPAATTPPDNAFVAAYRAGTATPPDVAERFLAAVAACDRADPPLRAFVATDAADLRAQARDAARRYREGHPLGPLDGVPVAVKDELDQAPYPTTAGTKFLGRAPAAHDATVVARLRAAGAMLVGKTNMHEAGMGITGINPHHGTPRNPHDPTRVTGGSSSGSAAAVAAGLCPAALSADAGGSIRIPAALCGVVGLKPTFGRVSERGAVPLCWSAAHVGVIGATARDVALAYAAIAGVDPLDPNTARQPAPIAPDFDAADLRGTVIGVYRPWFEDADPDVVAACRQALAALESAGASLREIEIPDVHLVRPAHFVTVAVEWATAFAKPHRDHARDMGCDVRLVKRLADCLRGTDYAHAQCLRRRISAAFGAALARVDVIATPSTGTTAPRIRPDALATGESDFALLDRMSRFVTAANLTGHPAISTPAGYGANGMPVGLQLIGRPWREDVLLRIADVADRLIERRPPRVSYRLLDDAAYRVPSTAGAASAT
jgi:Asp-tRNA(Asn)/Glu-tRNA(Gln) amidotransferase A subunit family amidase